MKKYWLARFEDDENNFAVVTYFKHMHFDAAAKAITFTLNRPTLQKHKDFLHKKIL